MLASYSIGFIENSVFLKFYNNGFDLFEVVYSFEKLRLQGLNRYQTYDPTKQHRELAGQIMKLDS
jgi:hypothetical protein